MRAVGKSPVEHPLAEQEREFYDAQYRQFLELPDADLVCNRGTLAAGLADPANPSYERRAVYRAALEYLLREPLMGRTALDYGCGTGDWGLMLAGEGALVTLLDLSPVAIQLGLRRALVSGVADRVQGVARDASDLACFRDGEFDLIFGSFALHHTLKYPRARDELLRVLKHGGGLLLVETYGNNPLLNAAEAGAPQKHRHGAERQVQVFGVGNQREENRQRQRVRPPIGLAPEGDWRKPQ